MSPQAPFAVGCDMEAPESECWEVLEWMGHIYRVRETFGSWSEADRRVKELWP